MSEFNKMQEALKDGKIVALEKNKYGDIIVGGSFNNYGEVIGSKYSSDNPKAMKLLPEVVFVKKEPGT